MYSSTFAKIRIKPITKAAERMLLLGSSQKYTERYLQVCESAENKQAKIAFSLSSSFLLSFDKHSTITKAGIELLYTQITVASVVVHTFAYYLGH